MGSNRDGVVPGFLTRRRLLTLAAAQAVATVPATTFASPSPIMEEAFVPAGSIDQWVAIRGRDRSRTPILFLHGGPCEAESPFLSLFAPWEERYVVAQWDQRGTGRTFGKSGTPPNMTMEQLTQDAIEVAQYVLGRVKARKLILVGFSWGAELGLNVIRARPELFHAFVGTGQPINGHDIFDNMRSSAVDRAEAAGDARAAAELKQLTVSGFADMTKLKTYFRWTAPFPNPGPDWDFIGKMFGLLGSPDKPKSAAAADFLAANPRPDLASTQPVCLQKLLPYSIEFDARAGGYDLQVPYFVIQGRNDPRCPPEAARAFVEQVRAPAKNFTAIDGGHFACLSNPTGFLDALDSDMNKLGNAGLR
jgi:pimeloyl-ACP methyl ester carboxylesterase